jgi:pimeloyl-ACP methyl ester carboxylesterase
MAASAKTNALSKDLALAAAGAGAAMLERRHLHRIASDPRRAVLESPPSGQPLRVHSADGNVNRIRAAALLFTGLGRLVSEQLLVPVARFAHRLRDPIARRAFFGTRLPLPRFSSPPMYAALRYVAFGPTASPALVALWERMLVSCAAVVRAAVGIALADMELRHALARLTVPALVMTGAQDRLTPPSHARRMAGELPVLHRLIELPETGHMGPLERPAEVAEALRELSSATESLALSRTIAI